MAKWFTADTHFGDERVIRKYRRPFRDVLEHDRYLVEAWNSLVGANDEVYHLGDLGDLNVLSQLNGRLKVVPGNHDRIDDLLQAGVSILEPWSVVSVKGLVVALNHDPFEVEGRRGPFFAFGHLHRVSFLRPAPSLVGVNVGVEVHYFRPISESELLYWLELFARSGIRLDGSYQDG